MWVTTLPNTIRSRERMGFWCTPTLPFPLFIRAVALPSRSIAFPCRAEVRRALFRYRPPDRCLMYYR